MNALESSTSGNVGVTDAGVTDVGVNNPQSLDPGDPGSTDRRPQNESSCSSLCWSLNKDKTGSPYHQPPPSYEETRAIDAAAASRALNERNSPLSMSTPKATPMSTMNRGRGASPAPDTATNPTADRAFVSTNSASPQGPVILHKSSKALYRAVAAQWGIACKMTDHCRCLDCQSHYFDCDYDLSEHDKTDGGLAAGTPIFLSEVIHGSACSIL